MAAAKKNPSLICALAAMLVFIAGVLLIQANALGIKNSGRSASLDFYTTLNPFEGGQDLLDDFLFIDIDEASLSALGQWPWPRVIFARAMEKILAAEPMVVGVDILQAETDRFNPDSLSALATDASNDLGKYFLDGDQALADALRDEPVVLATALADKTKNATKKSANILVKDKARFDIRSTPGIIFPVDQLSGLEGYGFVNVDLDHADNTVRYLPLLGSLEGELYPSFVLEMARVYEEDRMLNLDLSDGMLPFNSVTTGFLDFPVTLEANFIIHHGYSSRFNVLSMSEMFGDNADSDDLADMMDSKIIVIGSSAAGLNDLHATNIEQAVPGPLIQLSAIHQIMAERFLKFSPEIDLATIALLFVALLALFIVTGRDRINLGLVFSGLIIGVSFWLCVYVFNAQGYIINSFFLVAFGSSALLHALLQSAFLALNKKALQDAFGSYLAPEMVKEIERSGQQPELGGEKKELSVVMTDMRNFTALGESYGEDVEGFTNTMNRYMTAIAQPVLDNKGTLLKFIGDASMHIHGAPIDDAAHPRTAVETALGMIKAVESFNAELAEEGKPPVGLGAGVNTGEILVGNIGAKTKFGYDVLGDPVSVAARLESQTKSYGVLLIVGPDTVAKCKDDFDWWELDNIAVKGKEDPLRIYTPRKQTPQHDDFLEAYYSGKWDEIFTGIEVFKSAAPDMSAYYDNMVSRMKEGKPDDWDGIYRATSK
ncbi:MAG: Adenylate cyclase 1 [SAR116 cluster bacterium MED-G04]|nr:MAG: Adenylate cyclase 1 [SAR116 cluster bacterium MED-G04]